MNSVCKYEGDYESHRFDGTSLYETQLSDGTKIKYEGDFRNGKFDGQGTLTIYYLDNGLNNMQKYVKYDGTWENGEPADVKLIFSDEVVYEENLEDWEYCSENDHRFSIEINEKLQKDEIKYISVSETNSKKLPENCYDCIEGYFDPKKFIICSFETGEEIRRPDQQEREWIIQNCRCNKESS